MEKFSDLSISSSKIPPNLCDLPMEIVQMIMEKLDFTRRLIVRKTCKTLRKVIDGLKPCCCNEIKMTVGIEECEMKIEGYPIKYKTPIHRNDRFGVEKMITNMLTEFLTFIPDFRLDTLKFEVHDEKFTWLIFRFVYKKIVRQKLKVRSMVMKQYCDEDLYLGLWVTSKDIRVYDIHIVKKYEDDIMKVSVERREWTFRGTNPVVFFTKKFFSKYYREGQEDILVDEPSQLAPKETRVETAETTQND